MAELTMPKLSDSMADAVIIKWLKAPGERFRRGEALIEVETDKATVVYEAEADGTLEAILVTEGDTAAVGQAIATIGPDGAAATASIETSAPVGDGTAASGDRQNASPVARRTAVELGLSLREVPGTGPGGRITVDDVRRAADGPRPATVPSPRGRGDVSTLEPTATRATIARRMAESAATIPVFTVSADADVSQIVALRRGVREEGGDEAPSLNDFVIKAAALALREFPRFNASWTGETAELYSRVNVGFAVAAEDALYVPVVVDADRKPLAEIAAETRRLAAGARRRSLHPDDLQLGTFTVSNLGMFGVRSFTAIVDPPQAAILAVGSVRRSPVEDDRGGLVFRDVMTLTLSCDHRVVYGADGARFLSRLRELLERPLVLAR
ncbi:MAG: dihydrolipoamide acetyltransferase family protein [Gaiellaceae bacterium]